MKILVAVDGSKNSLDAVQFLVDHAHWYRQAPDVLLLTVHLPVPRLRGMGRVIGRRQLEDYYREEGEARLAAARRRLDAGGIRYRAETRVGPVAETIVQRAKEARCELVCIGTRGMSELGKAFVGSTATKVLHISTIPVLLVK